MSVPEWTVGDRLRKARELAGLSREDVATITGVTVRTLWNYEHDRTPPKRFVIDTYAELGHVDP